MLVADYDAESFLWCLLWTTHRYENGAVPDHLEYVFDGWTLRNSEHAALTKTAFMTRLKFNPTSSHKSSLCFIEDICEAFCDRLRIADKQARLAIRNGTVPPSLPRLLPVLLTAVKNLAPQDYTAHTETSQVEDDEDKDEEAQVLPENYLLSADSPAWARLGKADSFGRPPV
jgi:hypothetical protein